MKTKQTALSQATLGNASPLPPDDDRPPLPEGWVWTTIGEVTQSIGKIQPKETPEWQFTYLDISSIDNQAYRIAEPKTYYGSDAPSRAQQPVKAGDVLFSTVRTYLKNIALVPDIYDGQIASTGFSVLRSQSVILPKYLFYYSLTDDFLNALSKLQRGTSYPAVRDGDVRAQSIPLAPLPEQHRIVDVIETQFTRLDAAVAALHRVKANLARYKASVLKAACEGRLVPTDAALYRARTDDADNDVSRRGEATPQASTYAKMCEDAEAPGHAEPGGGCLALTADTWHRGQGEATPQPSPYAQMRGDAETPDPAEPGGGCLAPTDTDAGAGAYEPADVLLRRILAERRARWMADNPGKRYVEPSGPDTSGLPELPEGWVWATVEQLTILSQNGTGRRRSELGTPTIVLRLADIVDGEAIRFGDVRRIKLQEDEVEKYKLLKGDLLCIRVNGSPDLVGRVIHFTGSDEPITFCDHFIRFRLAFAELAQFLTMNFHTDRVRKYIDLNKVSSAGQNTVSQTTINAAILPLPPLAEQNRIVAEVERRLSVVAEVEAAVEANLARAARLRQAILREAFAGRLVRRGDGDTDGVGVV
jgi:restriction endonuclease S subunit